MTKSLGKIIFFVLLMAVTYAADRYLIRPADYQLAAQKARVQAKLSKLKEFEKAEVMFEGFTKQLDELQEAIDFFESKLPPTSEIDKVLQDITVIAQKQGLRSKRVLTQARKDNSGYVEQPLKMELVGNFNSFYSFLLEIEKLPRIMKFRELELKKQANSEGQIEANFVMSIFFQNKTS